MPKINPQKEALRIMGKIRQNVRNGKWTCMCEGCSEMAINSHLLMRNGILNYVVEEGHVYELHSDAPQAMRADKMPIDFKRVGVNQAISHPIFCKDHDDSLFEEIEKRTPDYTLYRHVALYSYRALCAEVRKKEIEVEIQKRIIQSSALYGLAGPDFIDDYKGTNVMETIGLRDLNYYKEQIKGDIDKGTESFVFYSRELPIKGVYASATSSLFASDEETVSKSILNILFIHLIPLAKSTQLVIGYHKEKVNDKILNYVQRWKEAKAEDIGAMLTALFTQIETWGMSPSIYRKLKPECEKAFYKKLENSFITIDQTPVEDINLFEGIL